MQQLRLVDWLDYHLLIEILHRRCEHILGQIVRLFFDLGVGLLVEVLLGSALTIVERRDQQRIVRFNVAQCVKNLFSENK